MSSLPRSALAHRRGALVHLGRHRCAADTLSSASRQPTARDEMAVEAECPLPGRAPAVVVQGCSRAGTLQDSARSLRALQDSARSSTTTLARPPSLFAQHHNSRRLVRGGCARAAERRAQTAWQARILRPVGVLDDCPSRRASAFKTRRPPALRCTPRAHRHHHRKETFLDGMTLLSSC